MKSVQSLKKNIASLGALHGVSFVMTLLTLSYLTRVLGADGWGRIVFIQIVINYMCWIVNWGFYLGATKRVSVARNDKAELSRIFLTTWLAQWCLTILLFFVLVVTVIAVPGLRESSTLYFSASLLLVGNVLLPLWYVNGLEQIRESAVIQLLVKLTALPFIFLLVNSEADSSTYFLINGLSSIFLGVLSLVWVFRTNSIRFFFPKLICLWRVLAQDFNLFLSSLWANLNTTLVPLSLGVFGSDSQLGYYNVADRVRMAAIQILHPITHALFPRMCHLFDSDKSKAWRFLKYSGFFLVSAAIVLAGIVGVFAQKILFYLGGDGFQSSFEVLYLLSFSVVIITASEFLIYQLLVPTGKDRLVNLSKIIALVVTLLLLYPLITYMGAKGAASVSLISEFIMLLVIVVCLYFNKFNLRILRLT